MRPEEPTCIRQKRNPVWVEDAAPGQERRYTRPRLPSDTQRPFRYNQTSPKPSKPPGEHLHSGSQKTAIRPSASPQKQPRTTATRAHHSRRRHQERRAATRPRRRRAGEPDREVPTADKASKAPARQRHTRASLAPTPSTTTRSDAASPTKQKPRPAARSSSRTVGSRDDGVVRFKTRRVDGVLVW